MMTISTAYVTVDALMCADDLAEAVFITANSNPEKRVLMITYAGGTRSRGIVDAAR